MGIIERGQPNRYRRARISNAGFWAVGRLQTDADRERIVESLTSPDRRPDIMNGEVDERNTQV
jgi:hypothetical protein